MFVVILFKFVVIYFKFVVIYFEGPLMNIKPESRLHNSQLIALQGYNYTWLS